MTRIDFSPLFRSTVGFDRISQLLESAARVDDVNNGFPPYNIEKLDENAYRVTMAVAGFGEDDLSIEVRENTLIVSGKHKEDEEGERRFLHRGIAGRAFQRTFQVADYVKVVDARLVNGLLHIDLVREIPEEMKPRKIKIQSAPEAKKIVGATKDAA